MTLRAAAGPTHDDVTLKGVAQGLGVAMVHNLEMEHFLHRYWAPAAPMIEQACPIINSAASLCYELRCQALLIV